MDISTIINQQWVMAAEGDLDTIERITELAMIEAGRVAHDSLHSFKYIQHVGRVVLVEIEPSHTRDPILPIVIDSTNATRRAAREMLKILQVSYKVTFYSEATKAAARYLSTANWLEPNELDFLQTQLNLCCVDPSRTALK